MDTHLNSIRIYVAIYEEDPSINQNPYTHTLAGKICGIHPNVSFAFGNNILWTDEIFQFDVMHIMWPHFFAPKMREGLDLELYLKKLKQHNIKIVATCHNLVPHNPIDHYDIDAYNIVYSNADSIIHLAQYSLDLFKQKYRNIDHVLISHHVYDELYTNVPPRQQALQHLHLNDGIYAICFGAFRHKAEKQLLLTAAKSAKGIQFIAPRLFRPIDIPHGKINKRWIKRRLRYLYQTVMLLYYKLAYPNILLCNNEFIPDSELIHYYAICSISFLQRIDILNSGNFYLGMLMGNVIVGPDSGNIGYVLKQTGNFVFDPHDKDSITESINQALKAVQNGKGEQNKIYATKNWSTEIIAEQHYLLYKNLCSGRHPKN